MNTMVKRELYTKSKNVAQQRKNESLTGYLDRRGIQADSMQVIFLLRHHMTGARHAPINGRQGKVR